MILPDLGELVGFRGIAQGLSLHSHRSALAHLQGHHRSAHRGRGLEFEEVRPYVPGDDARTIDWRVTARRGRPHTKLFREERERPVWIIADLHAGLFFGSKYQLKSTLLLRAAALLSWVAALGGDRLGAIIATDRQTAHILPPQTREVAVLQVLEMLVNTQPKAPGLPDPQSLNTALNTLHPVLQPGSLICVLSDFSNLDSNTETTLASLALHSDCRLIWITDPLESQGLGNGSYRLGIPGRLRWLNGEQSRPSWQTLWNNRKTTLETIAQRLQLPLIRLDTSNPIETILPALLKKASG